jgi:hypothetical protein
MTTATGPLAPKDDLRPLSGTTGILTAADDTAETFAVSGGGTAIVEGFRSGEDRLLLPAGTDLAAVAVAPDWQDDAWGLRVSYGEGDSVFLRWGWQFDAARDLAVAGTTTPEAPGGTESAGTGTAGAGTGDGTTAAPPPAGSGGAEAGTGADTLVLRVSADSYLGDPEFTVLVDGAPVGGVFTASAQHGAGSDTVTLRGDWGASAEVTVRFLNDAWGGTAATDRNLHIDGATYNGTAVEGAAQTLWTETAASFSAVAGQAGGGTEQPPQVMDDASNPDGEVNVLIRGQSNALLFADRGGAAVLETALEAKLGVEVNLLYAWNAPDDGNTIWSATRFMDWDADGEQRGLLNFIADLPAEVKDNPTLTVWMHNEYDQQSLDLTTDEWVGEVKADAALVRAALGQDAATTPYEFVPIRYPYGGNFAAIEAGMERLSAEAAFNADMSDAAWGARMDGGPEAGADGSHLGDADAVAIGDALAAELAPVLAALAGGDGGTAAPPPAGGEASAGTGADTLVLKVSADSYLGDPRFTVAVDGVQVGGVFTASADHGTASDTLTLRGDWGSDAKVAVTFLEDAWGGTAETDRNLWIDGATYNGKAVADVAQVLWTEMTVAFTAGEAATGGTGGTVTPPPPAGGTGGGTTPSGGGDPAGYTLVLSDDFSNGYDYDKWGWPFGGGVYWNGAFSWNSDDVGVRDGEMQVTITQQPDGWWTAGGFNSFKAGNTILYGKIEFDAKVPDYQGTMAAILTWPESDVWPRDGEIDILETPHNENMFSTHYAGPDGEHWYDSIRSNTFDASQWNHYEMTWLPDRLTIEVNGQLVAEWTDPSQIPDVPHGFGAMGFVGSGNDGWMGGAPDGSTPDQVVISLDNVRMYQLDGVL